MKEMPFKPTNMNLELTTNCPLRCPQCYCSLTGGKNLKLETALHWIKEGGKHGVKEVMLSGGETMCYPHLYKVIRAARKYCGSPNVALSGFAFTQEVYEKMIEAGVGGIFISLNGSTKEINGLTRDGFDLAISALELLQKNHYENTSINWVMHANNADDFPNMVSFAEKYNVANLVIIGVKPDSNHRLPTIPSAEQMKMVSDIVKYHKGKCRIFIESCFSPMLALTCDTKLFGNMNVGKNKGCGAGRNAFSVNVDGMLSPCRHLELFEKWETLEDYWNNSSTLNKIRMLESERREPCSSCKFCNYCRHCLAINSKLNNDLYIGNHYCPLAKEYSSPSVN